MAYVTLREILNGTREGGFGVGAFNFNGYEDSEGIVNAAVARRSRVILAASMSAAKYIGIETCVGMVRGMAESVDIPVCLHLDHATDMEVLRRCVDAGFSSVMIDASAKEFRENIRLTKEAVDYAHARGCSVEAELGKLGGREENVSVSEAESMFTDPEDVEEFVAQTGVDALAIAFGTAHGFYKAEPRLDFPRIQKIAAITSVPLVMHGGTGVSPEGFQRAIRCGISKINVGTELKDTYTRAIRQAVQDKPTALDPRDYMKYVKADCQRAVEEKIDIFGSAGK